MRVAKAAVMVSLTVTWGCAGMDRSAGRAAVRDSAGIRIIENVTPDDSAAHAWWTIGEPDIDIGGPDAAEAYALHRVTDALRTGGGLIVVANGVSTDVRVFDSRGAHVRTTGRQGGGPGEFASLNAGLERGAGDSILVPDPQNRRLTVLSPTGEFAREISLTGPLNVPRILGRFRDGTFVSTLQTRGGGELPTDGLARPPALLGRFSASGELLDTLGSFPGAERYIRVTTSTGRPATSLSQIQSIEIMATPFTKSGFHTASGTSLYIGPQDAGEILVHDTAGVLRRIIRTGRTPDPVTEPHLEAMWQRSLDAAPPDRLTEMRQAGRANYPHGSIVPPYAALIPDSEGNLWVADYDDPLKNQQGRWTVYDRDGAALARIALPPRFRPLDIGRDWILGLDLDDLDVEHVRLYPLLKPRT